MLQDLDQFDQETPTYTRRFEKIAIWELADEQKSSAAKTILEEVKTGIEYRSQMSLSVIIASLGLIIDATPVVIGAMLIAPIMRPIQAVSFATSTGNRKLFVKALRLLFLSIAVGIVGAFVVTKLIPFSQVTNEIAARTQPTLVDLFIAVASGIVAFLAFGYKKISASLAGVAMAASLVPPLCVIGIGIAFNSRRVGRGSSVLFLTNLVAIIVAGIFIFWLFGFSPTAKKSYKTTLINSASVIVMMLLLCVPLASSLISITRDLIVKDTITKTTRSFFHQIDESIGLQSIDYQHLKGGKAISLTMRVPQELLSQITDQQKSALTQQLAENLNSDVELDMMLVPITSVFVQQQLRGSPSEQIEAVTNEFLSALYRSVYLLDIEYYENQKEIIVATFYTEEQFDKVRFQALYEDYIRDNHKQVDVVVVNRQHETVIGEVPISDHQLRVQSFQTSFQSFFPTTELHKLTLDTSQEPTQVNLWISTPLSSTQLTEAIQDRKQQRELVHGGPLQVNLHATFQETIVY